MARGCRASCLSRFGVHCSLSPTVILSSPITSATRYLMRKLGQYQVNSSIFVYWNAPPKSRYTVSSRNGHHIHLPFLLGPGTAFFTGGLPSPGIGYEPEDNGSFRCFSASDHAGAHMSSTMIGPVRREVHQKQAAADPWTDS